MSEKSWGKAVVGWFIVQDENARSTDTSDAGYVETAQEVPAAEPYDAEAFFQSEPPPPRGGDVDFVAVFEAAGVDADERDRVAKAMELVRNLPESTEFAVKKQIVEASLKAFGVPIEKIIEAGAEEIQALEGYIRKQASDTSALIDDSERRISKYEQEIRDIRAVMQQQVEDQTKVIKSCNEKKLEVQKILEFFGQEAVARVVRDSPKLQNPPGT